MTFQPSPALSLLTGNQHLPSRQSIEMIQMRRNFLRIVGGWLLLRPLVAVSPIGTGLAAAQSLGRHGVSLFGQLKYPPKFAHFDYVNPVAPKLGTVPQGAFGTYDNFNVVVAGWKGDLAAGIHLIYESLLMPFAG